MGHSSWPYQDIKDILIVWNIIICFSDKSPLLQKGGSEHMFETMEMEIEQLLAKVKQEIVCLFI